MNGTTENPNCGDLPDDSPEDCTLTYLKQLISDIQSIQTSVNFNLFVIENQVYLNNNVVTQDVTTVSILAADPDTPGKSILSPIPMSPVDSFLQKMQAIANTFKVLSTDYPADKNLLITWDHGSAFGIFKKLIPDKEKNQLFESTFSKRFDVLSSEIIKSNPLTDDEELSFAIIKNKKFPRAIIAKESKKAGAVDPSTGMEILSNDALAEAIMTGFIGKNVEMLIMFNCCMQNMHTGYALRNCVNFLLAPESLISDPGYDYVTIINTLSAHPEIASPDLAKIVIDSMQKKFADAGLSQKFEEHALFAVELSDYENKFVTPLACLSNDLIAYMAKKPDGRANVLYSRRYCYEMTYPMPYYVIDINNWMIRLKEETNDAYVASFVPATFSNNCKNAICQSFVGSRVYLAYQALGGLDQRFPPTGYAIYFPPDYIANSTTDATRVTYINPNAIYPDLLIQAIKWQDFLDDLFTSSGS